MEFTTLDAEPAGEEVRVETHRGRQHLVAPVVMVREGVLNGGYLPFDAIAESVPGWNGRPVTAPPEANASGHPVDEDGNFVSANDAEFLESMRVGFIQAPEAVENLPAVNDESSMSRNGARAEIWVDLEAVEQVGDQAIEAVRAMAEGEELEVSTGYFHKLVDRGGTFNGERYDHEQFGLMPDHLALLPNEKGACSWADGCGAPRINERMKRTINQEDGDRVRWDADGQPRYGIIVDDQTGEDDADEVLVAVYAFDGDEWVRGDDTVNLSPDTFEVIEQFPTEPADEPVDDDGADNVDTSNLGDRVSHAVHILTGQSNDCSCGGHGDDTEPTGTDTTNDDDTTTMNTDYEALANALGIATDTLEDMDDDEVEALAESVDTGDDGGTDDDNATNSDDDAQDDLREQVAALTDEVRDLKEQQNADPEAEEAREYLAENTDRDAETLAEWPDDAALETARAHGFNGAGYAAPRGDRVNRLGQAGGPSANAGAGDPDTDYVSKAGAFNQLDAAEEGE